MAAKIIIGILAISLQVFAINGESAEKPRNEAFIDEHEIEALRSAYAELTVPQIEVIDPRRGRLPKYNDEQILNCLLDSSADIAEVITIGQNLSERCIQKAGDKLKPVFREIGRSKEEANDALNEIKEVIPECAEDNSDAKKALKCIKENMKNAGESLGESVKKIAKSLKKGKDIVKDARRCLSKTAEKGAKEMGKVGKNIERCLKSEALLPPPPPPTVLPEL